MGKLNFTPIQNQFFTKVSQDNNFKSSFYFTGGTALSVFYFNHRYSEDLDFFSEVDFNDELVISFMNKTISALGFNQRYTRRDIARIFEIVKEKDVVLKIDFVNYAFKRLKKGKSYEGVEIDSLLDIGANKIITINQRYDVKDFVDLYFFLKKFTLWDLLYAFEAKFKMEIDLILLASDFLKVETFDFMPRMIKPLKLDDLKKFFREKAKELASKAVEE